MDDQNTHSNNIFIIGLLIILPFEGNKPKNKIGLNVHVQQHRYHKIQILKEN